MSVEAKTCRTVRGKDEVFFVNNNGLVKRAEVSDRRFTPEQLKKKFPGSLHFIANKNLHNMPQGLKGALIYHQGKICTVLKSKCEHAIVEVLYPRPIHCPKHFYINFLEDEQGRFLQQVLGEPLGNYNIPLLAEAGYIKMDVNGPHSIRRRQGCSAEMGNVKGNEFFNDDETSLFVSKVHTNRGTREKKKMKRMVDVIYVKETSTRFDATPGSYSIPIGCLRAPVGCLQAGETDKFSYQDFADVPITSLDELLSLGKVSLEEFELKVAGLVPTPEMRTVIVPNSTNVRIKVLSHKEFTHLKYSQYFQYVKTNGFEYLFGKEEESIHSLLPGTIVSHWTTSSQFFTQRELTYDFGNECNAVYKKGFGSRTVSKSEGLNCYRDKRKSFRPHPTPFVADEDIKEHQFISEGKLLQPAVEKLLHALTKDAVKFAEIVNPPLMEMVGEFCEKSILTCGRGPNYRRCPIAFVNECHRDTVDVPYKKELQSWRVKFEDNRVALKLMDFKGFCLPTTCGYQQLWREKTLSEKYLLLQYFMCDGLGIGLPIGHGSGHHFLGASFSHRTSLCLIKSKENGKIILSNKHDIAYILAWGQAGGSKDARS